MYVLKKENEGTGDTVGEVLDTLLPNRYNGITDEDLKPDNLIQEVLKERLKLIRSGEKTYISNLTLLSDTVHTALALKKIQTDKDNMNSSRELTLDVIRELGKLTINPFTSKNEESMGTIPEEIAVEVDDIVPGETEIGITDLKYEE